MWRAANLAACGQRTLSRNHTSGLQSNHPFDQELEAAPKDCVK
jgi:hypothetical protein